MTKHILFVEDDETQCDMFQTALADWNGKNASIGRRFTAELAESVERATEYLHRRRFDAALFDLRIQSEAGGKPEPKGNDLAKFALNENGIPVAVISANTSELDETVRDAGAVAVFDKLEVSSETNYYDRALTWLGDQWDMMDVLAVAKRAMDRSAADIFLARLWPRWKTYSDLCTGADRVELEKIVTRQYVSHMADLLGLDDPENVSWHPFENYISPALMSSRAHTGDIFDLNDGRWVVLTPQCDMATRKIENVLLAKCVLGIPNWKEIKEKLKAATSKTAREACDTFFKRYLNQNLEPSKHFLPPLPGEDEPLLVHFGSLKCVPLEEIEGQLTARKASISTPFLSNIVQRFGSYASRTGQPNIDMARL